MKFFSVILSLLAVSVCHCQDDDEDPVGDAINRIVAFQNCKIGLREKGCDVQTISNSEDDVDICPLFLTPYCYQIIHSGINVREVPSCRDLSIDDFSQFNFMSVRYLSKLTARCGEDFGLQKTTTITTRYHSSTTSTVVVVPTPTPVITGRCGPGYGSCDEFECCSRYGFCGVSKEYCSTGCQSEYGKCILEDYEEDKEDIPVSFIPGRCGPLYGRCEGQDECCSQYGYCGDSEDHCSINSGCQIEYGICSGTPSLPISKTTSKTSSKTTSSKTTSKTTTSKTTTTSKKTNTPSATSKKNVPTSTVAGRCGRQFGGACANPNLCCSQYGYCGESEDHCGVGCQGDYGHCNGDNATKSTTTITVTSTVKNIPTSTVVGRCGITFGRCAKANTCCSKYGYCGTNSKYCNDGCQPQYGICH